MDGGSRVSWVKAAIAAGRPYAARQKTPWVHNGINIGATAVLLGLTAALVWLCGWVSWVFVPFAALAFGWLYFALFILVVHEASHNMYVLLENRPWQRNINRFCGWIIAGIFATNYGKHWERGHLEHHVRPMEPDDPQRSVATGSKLLWLSLGYVFIPGFLPLERTVLRARRRAGKSSGSKLVTVGFLAFWTCVLTMAVQLSGWPLAVALYFGIPVVAVMNLLKGGLEHGGPIAEEPNPYLRSRTTLFALRRLLLPFNISLHFEHHLNYQVPWYDLVRYQHDLREIVPDEVQNEVFNSDVWAQLTGRLGGMSPAARAVTGHEAAETAQSGTGSMT